MSRVCTAGTALALTLAAVAGAAQDAEPARGLARWDALAYGHHRAVVRVGAAADAVVAVIRWRRPDHAPETRDVVIVDAATGLRVANVARVALTRESGTLAFQPATVPGDYFVDASCIDCGACRWIAPATFDGVDGYARVHRQPRSALERRDAARALVACPTASIGARDKAELRAAAPKPDTGQDTQPPIGGKPDARYWRIPEIK